MEELELQEKPGLFSRLTGLFGRAESEEDEEGVIDNPNAITLRSAYRYHVTVRRQVTTFDEAYAAANGLKRGEQQILNLSLTEPSLRQKIVDFMSGVSFAQDANWEEIGEHVFLIAPGSAYVEVSAEMPKNSFLRN
ncbi:MAG TPA: cell division protein SepF [Fimbriimonadaceae bacterium]|nr:cell division protein SepF [Fimbriimonadaceae bacterium]